MYLEEKQKRNRKGFEKNILSRDFQKKVVSTRFGFPQKKGSEHVFGSIFLSFSILHLNSTTTS